MTIVMIIFFAAALLCFGYYMVISLYAGFGTSFSPMWLFMTAFFLIAGLIVLMLIKHHVKVKPAFKVITAAVFAIGIIILAVVETMIVRGMNTTARDNLDYIIVLGAHVKGDKPSKSLRMRIEAAYDYLVDNPNTVVVVSGGQGDGENITEAQCMHDVLVEMGMDDERILIEDRATSTVENIRFSMEIVGADYIGDDEPKVGIVTNNFHVFRAKKICAKMGYDMDGVAARSDSVLFINYMLREFCATIQHFITGQI